MSLFGDVNPGSPQSGTPRTTRSSGGAGFDSVFVRIPLVITKLIGKGFIGFIYVLVGSSKKSNKVYYHSGPSWRKWPW